jgi:hypothetical protein
MQISLDIYINSKKKHQEGHQEVETMNREGIMLINRGAGVTEDVEKDTEKLVPGNGEGNEPKKNQHNVN